jgi:putative SOS response-associated peptidase YedK
MPAILPPEDWATWLGETHATLSEVKATLTFEDRGSWAMTEQVSNQPRKRKPTAITQADLL